MPLQDYISSDEDERNDQVAEFLQSRWSNVLDKSPVSELQERLESRVWFAKSFKVEGCEIGDPIRAHFSFVAEGLDSADRPTGEVVGGSAVAEIDEFDNVDFVDVKAEQES